LDAEEVEKNLGVALNRANRWNAILLLDEADVYIRKRQDDLNQNAIVGAFLRVLEYASCILFMTTNRADIVDDAIASRCIAKLHYDIPTTADQEKIWKILTGINQIKMADSEIPKVVKRFPKLSGRDVKNLLKLASFVHGPKEPVTLATVEYVSQFKPTE
jgi:SpoVK/Ycf46/Vps4 family AAA+-type ATPase